MQTISIKKEYARDWTRLMRQGTIETDGRTARYISKILSANGMKSGYECFNNAKTRRTIFKLTRLMKHNGKKQSGWKRVKFYMSF